MFRFLMRILLFPIYFIVSVLATFAGFITHFAAWIIGLVLSLVFIGGVCAAFMHDFHSVGTAIMLVAIASVFLTVIGLAQGILEAVRNSVGEVVFG